MQENSLLEFITGTMAPGHYQLSGRYWVAHKAINAEVVLVQNGMAKYTFRAGNNTTPNSDRKIVQEAVRWLLKQNKTNP